MINDFDHFSVMLAHPMKGKCHTTEDICLRQNAISRPQEAVSAAVVTDVFKDNVHTELFSSKASQVMRLPQQNNDDQRHSISFPSSLLRSSSPSGIQCQQKHLWPFSCDTAQNNPSQTRAHMDPCDEEALRSDNFFNSPIGRRLQFPYVGMSFPSFVHNLPIHGHGIQSGKNGIESSSSEGAPFQNTTLIQQRLLTSLPCIPMDSEKNTCFPGGGLSSVDTVQANTHQHLSLSNMCTDYKPDSIVLPTLLCHQRSKKKCVPNGEKDEKYFTRRARNNVAAKRSRDSRKRREDDLSITCEQAIKANIAMDFNLCHLAEHIRSLQRGLSLDVRPSHKLGRHGEPDREVILHSGFTYRPNFLQHQLVLPHDDSGVVAVSLGDSVSLPDLRVLLQNSEVYSAQMTAMALTLGQHPSIPSTLLPVMMSLVQFTQHQSSLGQNCGDMIATSPLHQGGLTLGKRPASCMQDLYVTSGESSPSRQSCAVSQSHSFNCTPFVSQALSSTI